MAKTGGVQAYKGRVSPEAPCCMSEGIPDMALADARGVSLPNPANLLALQTQAKVQDLQDAYDVTLTATVFRQPISDRKAAIRYQKTLLGHGAYEILHLIWRESPYVSEADLQAMGIARIFVDRPLTCWGLAVHVAGPAERIGRVHKSVGRIIEAGRAYQLIDMQERKIKQAPLVGSVLLHQFVHDLSQVNSRIIAAAATAGTSVGGRA